MKPNEVHEWGAEGNDQPLVCICIPIYNAESTIKETLMSVVNQTYKNLVINLIDNASTDQTVTIIQAFDDPRICIHQNNTNIGGERNFNRCIELAQGKYTAIFHADDVYEPQIVEKQVMFLEANLDAGAVFTEASLIDTNGTIIGSVERPYGVESITGLYQFKGIFKSILKHYNFLVCPSAMVRTAVYQKEIHCWRWGLFGSGSDLDVWFQILQNHSIGILPELLMRYRISKSQWSESVRLEVERADFFRVIDFYLEKNNIVDMLHSEDYKNYAKLERRDRAARAINLFLTGRYEEARQLCYDVLSVDAFYNLFQSKRGLVTFLIGLYIPFLMLIRAKKIGRISLAYMKRTMHK